MKRICSGLLALTLAACVQTGAGVRRAGRADALQAADRIYSNIVRENRVWGAYPVDLSLDAMLELYLASGDAKYRDYPLSVMYRRNLKTTDIIRYESQPFGHLNYRLYLATGLKELCDPFVSESLRYYRETPRSSDGLVLHSVGKNEPPRVLIDSMQDYASRMAHAGSLSGQEFYYAECVDQFRKHRDLLRRADSGLWSQGRGWEPGDPDAVSSGAWSRGQGWVLRGMTDSLDVLPPDSPYFSELRGMLVELLDALRMCQDEEGMWHALPDLPFDQSEPETSGTALICRALYKAVHAGWVPEQPYRAAADRAFAAVMRRVREDGMVSGACIGPGPLNRDFYGRYHRVAFKEDNEHGAFAVLYACAARVALDGRPEPAHVGGNF